MPCGRQQPRPPSETVFWASSASRANRPSVPGRLERQGGNDAECPLRVLVLLVETPLDAAAEGDVVPGDQTIVDDLAPERQENRLDQPRQIWTDDFLQRIGQAQNTVGFVGGAAATEEDRVLCQIAENVELADDGMFPSRR